MSARKTLTRRRRRWLYQIAASAMPILAGYGLVTEDMSVLWLGLVGAVLQSGPLQVAAAHTKGPDELDAQQDAGW